MPLGGFLSSLPRFALLIMLLCPFPQRLKTLQYQAFSASKLHPRGGGPKGWNLARSPSRQGLRGSAEAVLREVRKASKYKGLRGLSCKRAVPAFCVLLRGKCEQKYESSGRSHFHSHTFRAKSVRIHHGSKCEFLSRFYLTRKAFFCQERKGYGASNADASAQRTANLRPTTAKKNPRLPMKGERGWDVKNLRKYSFRLWYQSGNHNTYK